MTSGDRATFQVLLGLNVPPRMPEFPAHSLLSSGPAVAVPTIVAFGCQWHWKPLGCQSRAGTASGTAWAPAALGPHRGTEPEVHSWKLVLRRMNGTYCKNSVLSQRCDKPHNLRSPAYRLCTVTLPDCILSFSCPHLHPLLSVPAAHVLSLLRTSSCLFPLGEAALSAKS